MPLFVGGKKDYLKRRNPILSCGGKGELNICPCATFSVPLRGGGRDGVIMHSK